MKFNIATSKINYILGKVSKGLGKNKVMPITQYLYIKIEDGELSVSSTNMSNFVTYHESCEQKENVSVVVQAETLMKLCSKTTSKEITFTVREDHLEMKGNGKYKIPTLNVEEFPTYPTVDLTNEHSIVNTSILKDALKVNNCANSKDMFIPVLSGFYITDKIVTTDGIKMCINDVNLTLSEQVLITEDMVNLISVLNEEQTSIYLQDGNILIHTDTISIFGPQLNGIEEFPRVQDLSFDYNNYIVVGHQALSNALDRLSVFITEFDNFGVKVAVGKDTLTLSDLKGENYENIEYTESNVVEEVEVLVNVNYLKQLTDVLKEEVVRIGYDQVLPLQLTENNVRLIVSTMEAVNESE